MADVRTTLGTLAKILPHLEGPSPTRAELERNHANHDKPLDTCAHDWRLDNTVILESDPPQHPVLCATCGASTCRRIPEEVYMGYVRDWNKRAQRRRHIDGGGASGSG